MQFKIYFTDEQIRILNDALIELPYKKAAPLVAHINSEIQRHFDNSIDDIDVRTGAHSENKRE